MTRWSGNTSASERRVTERMLPFQKPASNRFRSTAWVVMPAYREAAVIGATVQALAPYFDNMLVVDDCSPDETAQAARDAGAMVCRHPVNLGQGASIQTGIELALARGAEQIVTFDADGQHRPEDAVRMLETLDAQKVDIVLGSRFIGLAEGISRRRRWLLKLAVAYTRLTTGLTLTDTHNGLRVMTASAARSLRIRHNRMAHASELLGQIAQKKLRYVEAPCTIVYTDYSRAKGQRMSGAFAILWDLAIGKLYR